MSQAGIVDFIGNHPQIPITFVTDSGNATPALNILNVLGAANVTTSGSGNTINISVDGSGTFTQGSVIFAGSLGAFSEDNANFFWDSTNHRLSLGGSIVPNNTLTVHGDSYFNGNISQVGAGDTVALGASTIQFAFFSTGIAHLGATGIISSGPVDLGSADVVGVLNPPFGGTGIGNAPGSTITLGGAIVTQGKLNLSGLFDATFNFTGTTNVIFPVSGTLATTAGTVASVTGTANRITIGGTSTNPTVDIAATYVGQASITTLGTIATGTWNGSVISGQYGGTGVANTGLTINLGSGATGKYLASDSSGNGTWVTLSSGAVTTLTGTANQVLVNATSGTPTSGAITLTLPQSIATNSNVSFATVGAINAGGNFQSFISNSSTTATSTSGLGYYIRNSNTTTNNWMTYGFLSAAGNVCSIIGCQVTDQTGGTQCDIVLFGRNSATTVVEGLRLVGTTNTITLANALPAASGGTGIASYTVGDILYASGSTALSKLSDVATGNALVSGGTTTAPSWGKIGLTTHVSGILPVANGGTGATAFTSGSVVFAGGSGVYTQDNSGLFYDDSTNRLGIGNFATSPDVLLTLNANSAVTVAPTTGGSNTAYLHMVGAAAANPMVMIDAFGGGANYIISRSAQGTVASPTQVTSGSLLLQVGSTGRDSTSYSGTVGAGIQILSTENWTNTARGCRLTLFTTVTGSTTVTDRFSIDGSGNITLQATSGAQLIINNVSSATASTTGGGLTLPLLAAGYLQVTLNGTQVKIPYYAN